ncbi:Aldehyde dehydrogenase N-terminal [Penicillium chermesinum]|uniref:Aldehyde dehydrogenase N-terminal n=1 Tax=Penicillium chermesinum TaxID=63820 RepID=A0A9W9TXP4_9EURO|nr:Aldehyde dehydrogenase N-terminal [Penicillium chermesinum]KAJ5246773.1 Aldehyde dehydrogenase N-terminal [Penicillium chermesinum]
METTTTVPLIIDGEDVVLPSRERWMAIPNIRSSPSSFFQGATKELAIKAAESSAHAFTVWSKTTPVKRRELLLKLAAQLCDEEVHSGALWADVITNDSIGIIEECASLTTSITTGSIPFTQGESYGFVFKEPLGVILGIAPWNAPVVLGFRAVIAPIAAGNVAILKGSELSPRIHYLIASLFREAGFPPGVVNFLLHRPEDAPEIFDILIKHRAVKKCNFTGSTQVGRIIASQAAMALKPVLLELGGKNFTIVLEDANLDLAAKEIVKGAFLNNGQICMSTDLVITTSAIASILEEKILSIVQKIDCTSTVISPAAKSRLDMLVTDAQAKGAEIYTAPMPSTPLSPHDYLPTVITGLTKDMIFYETESFGPVVGMVSVDSEAEIIEIAEQATYGLSASIISSNHYRAMKLSESIKAGAVHINSMTVHDEPTLPHGGHGESGWGRFGSKWGMEEFVQTKTVTLHP